MSECYVVLGPSRTGTSLCAGLIKEMGVWLGNQLKKGGSYGANQNYYEDMGLVKLATKEQGTARDIVKRLERPKWGIKMPHLIRLWEQHGFDSLIENPRFIVCHRNTQAVITSQYIWVDRKSTLEQKTAGVANYYTKVHDIVGIRPCLHIQYEFWFNYKQREEQLEELGRFTGLEVTNKVRNVINPDLWRIR